MKINVLYFGLLKQQAKLSGEVLELPAGCNVEGLLKLVCGRLGPVAEFSRSLAVAVNREYAPGDRVLHEGDEVALLPPVSGGSDFGTHDEAAPIQLVRQTIETNAIVAAVKSGADGAVVVFDGIVRDNTRGRRTLFLDYEAYETMAIEQMRALVGQALESFPVRQIALVHRLGRMEIGETSVLIVVASAHRGAAFEACRWVIDTLKKTVPIWKKEHFVDGAVWADGEPFPAAIALGSAVISGIRQEIGGAAVSPLVVESKGSSQ